MKKKTPYQGPGVNLRKSAFSAGRWTSASLILRAALQLGQTLLLARLLTPSDFGLMAIVMATYGVLSLLIDLGLSNALIHFPDPSRKVASSLFWLNLGGSISMMAVVMVSAWPMSQIYDEPSVLPAMITLSIAMPLNALGQQFRVIAEKELKFQRLAAIEVAAGVCGFVVAVTTAALDGGVYSLIAAILASSAISSALSWTFLSNGLRPYFHFELSDVKKHLAFGSYRLGDTLLISVQMQADVLIGASLTGSTAMGIYTVPRDLTLRLANTLVNPIVTRVGLPVMAKMQSDKSALKSIYLKTMRMTSSINFPIYSALMLWPQEIVAIALGPQWEESASFMRIFAGWALLRSTANPVGSLLNATGRVRLAFWWDLALLFATPPLLYAGHQLGSLHGLAMTMIGIQLLTFYPHYRVLVAPACGATFREYVNSLLPACVSTAFAVGTGLAIQWAVDGPSWLLLALGLSVGGCVYLLSSIIFNREWISAMAELIAPLMQPVRSRLTAK